MKKPNYGKVGTEEEGWLQSDFKVHRSMSEEEIKARFSSGAAYSEDTLGNALLGCAYSNELRMAEGMVESYRAPIDFVDPRTGLTALHIAVGRDHLDLAKYLVKMGAPFLPDNQGRTPTTIAAECEVSDEMCDFIAEAEAKAEGV
jgi:ankyrin repeat protein